MIDYKERERELYEKVEKIVTRAVKLSISDRAGINIIYSNKQKRYHNHLYLVRVASDELHDMLEELDRTLYKLEYESETKRG